MNSSQTLGECIRDARVAKKLSLRDVTSVLEIAPSYLSDIENDRRVPSEDVLRSLSKHLDLDFDDLMARAGRLGDKAERYLKRTPAAGVLFRRISESNLAPEQVERLVKQVDKLVERPSSD